MRKSGLTYLSFLLLITLMGCASKVIPGHSSKPYNLDLSSYRPAYSAGEIREKEEKKVSEKKETVTTPSLPSGENLTINKKLDTLLDTMAQRNKAAKYVAGFRIQLYTGTKRNELEMAKSYVYQSYSELNTYIAYNHPTYRLRVGDFATRLDAERYLSKLNDQYPAATIISDRVTLRDALKIMDSRRSDTFESSEP